LGIPTHVTVSAAQKDFNLNFKLNIKLMPRRLLLFRKDMFQPLLNALTAESRFFAAASLRRFVLLPGVAAGSPGHRGFELTQRASQDNGSPHLGEAAAADRLTQRASQDSSSSHLGEAAAADRLRATVPIVYPPGARGEGGGGVAPAAPRLDSSLTQLTEADSAAGPPSPLPATHAPFALLEAAAAQLLPALGVDLESALRVVAAPAGPPSFEPLALAERFALLEDAHAVGVAAPWPAAGSRGVGELLARAEGAAAGAAARAGARGAHALVALRVAALRRRVCGEGGGDDAAWARVVANALAAEREGSDPGAAAALLPEALRAAALGFLAAHGAGLPLLRRRAFEGAVARAAVAAAVAAAPPPPPSAPPPPASGPARRSGGVKRARSARAARASTPAPTPARAAATRGPLSAGAAAAAPPASAALSPAARLCWGAPPAAARSAASASAAPSQRSAAGGAPAFERCSAVQLEAGAAVGSASTASDAERSVLGAAPSEHAASFSGSWGGGTGTQPTPGARSPSPGVAPALAAAAPASSSPLRLAELEGAGDAAAAPALPKRARRSSLRSRGAPKRNLRVSLAPEYVTSPEDGGGGEECAAAVAAAAHAARSAPRRRPLQVLAASQVPTTAQRGAKLPAMVLAARRRGGIAGWLARR
jgi:hypothetical protein